MADKKSKPKADLALERGLPSDTQLEKYVLGSVLQSPKLFAVAAGKLDPEDFSLEVNRRIYRCLLQLHEQSMPIDRMMLANELRRRSELESVGGLTYLVDLDEGMPKVANIDGWLGVLKEKSTLRQIIFTAQHEMNRALCGEPAREILESSVSARMDLMPDDGNEDGKLPGQILEEFEGGVNAFLQPHLRRTGISTGFTKFDEMTGGLQCSDLIILSGRPGHGKSAIALNIAEWVAFKSEQGRVLMFSLEMSREQLLQRMVCSMARVDSQRFRRGYLNPGEREKLAKVASVVSETDRLIIDDSSATTALDVQVKTRKARAKYGPISLVIVDYLQLMGSKEKTENRSREIGLLTRHLKLTAKEENVALLAISSLNRKPDERKGNFRPMLSDMREGGSIEFDSDLVLAMFREELYTTNREDLRGEAELLVLKARHGPTGVVRLVFLGHLTKFENRVEDVPGFDSGEPQDYKKKQGKDRDA